MYAFSGAERPRCDTISCVLRQEMVGHRDTLVQQPARVLAQIQHQPLDIVLAQPLQVLFHLPAVVSPKLRILRYA